MKTVADVFFWCLIAPKPMPMCRFVKDIIYTSLASAICLNASE